MNKLLYFILLIVLLSCQPISENKQTPETVERKENVALKVNGLEISADVLSEIEQSLNKKYEPFKREIWKFYENGNEENYTLETGIVFKFVDENSAHAIFIKYHDEIYKNGNYLFLTNLDFDDHYNSYYDIVITKDTNQLKLVELFGTNGINYDIYNQEVVNKLREWDKRIGLKIEVIDEDRIHAFMMTEPNNIREFGEEVYKFCPDVIDQGYSSMEEMIIDYKTNRYLWLWWD